MCHLRQFPEGLSLSKVKRDVVVAYQRIMKSIILIINMFFQFIHFVNLLILVLWLQVWLSRNIGKSLVKLSKKHREHLIYNHFIMTSKSCRGTRKVHDSICCFFPFYNSVPFFLTFTYYDNFTLFIFNISFSASSGARVLRYWIISFLSFSVSPHQ